MHTTFFDAEIAQRLHETVVPFGSLLKGHYTDWVENPRGYPASGMGGANVGPEFTAEEYHALADLSERERAVCRHRPGLEASQFMSVLEKAVVESGRWKKWLQPEEKGFDFGELAPERQAWLTQTGARYIWTEPSVIAAREELYGNLQSAMSLHPHRYVVDRIARTVDQYLTAFNLSDSLTLFEGEIEDDRA